MFVCNNCDAVFREPAVIYERHGFTYGPYEEVSVCPECRQNGMFEEIEDAEE